MALTQDADGAWWYVCPAPCGRHRARVAELERAVRAELLQSHPDVYDLTDPDGSVTRAVLREVTHVHVVGDRDFVAHFSPVGSAS